MAQVTTFLLIFITLLSYGQKDFYIHFNTDQNDAFQQEKIKNYNSKEDVFTYLNELRAKKVKKGYVLASVDHIEWVNDTAYVDFYLGKKFQKIVISFDQKDAYIIRKTPKFNERLISHLPFEPQRVEQLLQGISDYLNSNGYPFSKVYLKLDKLQFEGSKAQLIIERGPLVKIKEVLIKGESKVKVKYVQNAISIKEGDIYNKKDLRNISLKIEQIEFLKEIRPHEILFTPEGAKLYLYLESIPVSLINGIVGLQPNPVTQKTTITGEVQLKLLNIIKHGEELNIHWKSLQPKTQELDLAFNFPFLFNTPFGIDARFNLYKLDSTYLKTNIHLGIRYYLSGGSYIKVFYQAENSNLLSGASSVPNGNFSSVSSNNYGIGLFRNKTDYLPNPSRGFLLSLDVAAGRRKSKPVEEENTVVSTTFRGNLLVEGYIPITYRHVIRLANTTHTYFAPTIFRNELYKFGGLKTQRGFNEETLLATTFTTFTAEYRFLVDKNSHAFAFFDQSFYEDNSKKYTKDQPFGFGVGYSFGTKLGVFSISYALGKQFNNPIQIRDGKVHFGYIAYF